MHSRSFFALLAVFLAFSDVAFSAPSQPKDSLRPASKRGFKKVTKAKDTSTTNEQTGASTSDNLKSIAGNVADVGTLAYVSGLDPTEIFAREPKGGAKAPTTQTGATNNNNNNNNGNGNGGGKLDSAANVFDIAGGVADVGVLAGMYGVDPTTILGKRAAKGKTRKTSTSTEGNDSGSGSSKLDSVGKAFDGVGQAADAAMLASMYGVDPTAMLGKRAGKKTTSTPAKQNDGNNNGNNGSGKLDSAANVADIAGGVADVGVLAGMYGVDPTTILGKRAGKKTTTPPPKQNDENSNGNKGSGKLDSAANVADIAGGIADVGVLAGMYGVDPTALVRRAPKGPRAPKGKGPAKQTDENTNTNNNHNNNNNGGGGKLDAAANVADIAGGIADVGVLTSMYVPEARDINDVDVDVDVDVADADDADDSEDDALLRRLVDAFDDEDDVEERSFEEDEDEDDVQVDEIEHTHKPRSFFKRQEEFA
ncbi:hypothetical protein V5O48_013604 [Marasmius crinis-equi]|uniref:Uncharacterized protein n=1 Tax=Marasmius crinis-equi TaxID=585013 RepID=A0ABR3F007_9AGAR